jgi:hypothetical protein
MKTRWIIDGYTSANHATNAANKRGESGLTGSGQSCGPINMSFFGGCRGWVYKTGTGGF